MSKLTSHPEFGIACQEFIRDMDIPDALKLALTPLVACSLARVHFRFWLEQDVKDAEWVADPDDGCDPMWHQIDGWPEKGGGDEEILTRKWRERVRLYRRWYGVDVWHVVDWLTVADGGDHAWLYRLDEDGYPVKLTKCGDLDRLVAEATKGLRDRNAKIGGEIVLGPREEERVADLGVGYSLVQMHTPTAMRREGLRMHNCLKTGGYGRNLIDRDFSYFSVRDAQDKPVATLEVKRDTVSQFRAACNADPGLDMIYLVSGVADAQGWTGLMEAADGSYAPYGREALVVLEDLPPVRRRI